MKQGRLRILGALVLAAICLPLAASPLAAQGKLAVGKLTGVVRDTSGTPQLGASVEIVPETAGAATSLDFFTNVQGIFRTVRLTPGFYTVRVTLAGFLPTLEQHVRVTASVTTIVRIQLESMFASLDQLRSRPSASASEPDDWKWVLRSASSMRPVLQWVDDDTLAATRVSAELGKSMAPRARIEFTDGARRMGSASNLPSSPATAFAYDQSLGGTSRLLLAGQMSYESDAPAGGIAAVWLPTGSAGTGPHTALALRESKLGPDGATFRGVRVDQGGAVALGDRAVLHYGAEYVLVGLGSPASSIRPRLELVTRVSDGWHAALIFASQPTGPAPLETSDGEPGGALAAALNELDAFPALLWRDGHSVLQSGYHEEVAAEHKWGTRGKLQMAAFHDDNRHLAVLGRGNNLPEADYFQDYFSNGFSYDGGSSSSWGTRVALRERLADDLEWTAVYAFAGALAPANGTDGSLRGLLRTNERHSVGTAVSAKLPYLRTKVNAGYKWISGDAISHVDPYGESLYQMEPFLHVGLRQPLPRFAPGRWEASAECDNLFAQGYVSVSSRDGRAVLTPAFRTFRGGLSLQF